MKALERLEQAKWIHPPYYSGFSPDGDYLIYSQHRDSNAIERSNYQRILEDLRKVDAELQEDENEPFVYDFRAKHWAVGWIEYILVSKTAPIAIKQKACEILLGLDAYPVYDEDHLSDLEYNEACDYWESLSIAGRIEAITKSSCGLSILAARHKELPSDDNGGLLDWLRQ